MKTPRKPPVPAGERVFGFQAQVPCQGLSAERYVNGVNIWTLARDVRLTDRPARRRGLGVAHISHAVCEIHGSREYLRAISTSVDEIDPVERPRRARARARAQAHQRLGTFPRRAVQRTAHGSAVAKLKPDGKFSEQASLYARGSPSSRPRDGGFAGGARTREDIRLPQRSEDRRRGGLTTEYNEFAELSRQTVEFLNPDMTTVRETLYDVVYDDDGVNGDRDALGRITKKTEWIVSGDEPNGDGTPRGLDSRTYDYGYNPEGRPWLESVAVDGDVVSSYGYDDNGNRTSAELSWSQLGYDAKFDVSLSEGDTEYDSADKLLVYGSKSYEWNNFGQLSSMTDSDPDSDPLTVGSETTFYQYDLFGNLLRVDLPDGRAIEYDVDGAGRRVGRRELDSNGDQLSFRGWIYRDLLRPIAEVDELGNVVARYVYGDGSGAQQNGLSQLSTRLGAYPGGALTYVGVNVPRIVELLNATGETVRTLKVVVDQVGSLRALVDIVTGEIVQRADYDEFGRTMLASGESIVPFGFGGGFSEPGSGLTRLGARDYEPSIGRWTARDPITPAYGSRNGYAYTRGDPINMGDPTGLYFCNFTDDPILVGGGTRDENGGDDGAFGTGTVAPGECTGPDNPVDTDQGPLDDVDVADFDGDGQVAPPMGPEDTWPIGEKIPFGDSTSRGVGAYDLLSCSGGSTPFPMGW